MLTKTGPHIQHVTPAGLAWAAKAPLVKALDDPTPLRRAPAGAIKIFRRYFPQQDMGRHGADVARDVLAALGDAAVDYIELYNETAQRLGQGLERHVALTREAVGYIRQFRPDLKVCGYSFSTGSPEPADWAYLRQQGWGGADAIGRHAYWGLLPNGANPAASFTPWNALRHRTDWRPGDVPILLTEIGRDKVRDGAGDVYVGAGGWIADGVSAEQYIAELAAYDALIGQDAYVLGATPFTSGAASDWAAYQIDGIADRLIALTQPPTPQPQPIPGGNMAADYPKAEWVPGCVNFGSRSGEKIVAIVNHIADGTWGQTKPWFLNPASQSSSTYFITRLGKVYQIVREADSQWTNGVDYSKGYAAYKSNLAIWWIKRGWETGVDLNDCTVTIEHEGKPIDGLTESQYKASLALNAYLVDKYDIPANGTHIVGHYQISGVDRANCPGAKFPWTRLFADLLAAQPAPTYNILGFATWLAAQPQGEYGAPRHDAREFGDGSGDLFVRLMPTPLHPDGPYLIYRKYLHTSTGDLMRAITSAEWA